MMGKKKDIPEGYWDSPLGVIPKGWEVKRVSEVFVPLHTFSFSRDQMTLNRQKLHYIHYGDIHVNVEKDYVDLKKDQLPYVCDGLIPDEKLKSEDFPYLKNGDILLADASEDYDGVGKPWELIDISNQKVIGGLHTLALRSYTGDVVVGFGRYIFKNSLGAKFLKRIAQGTKVYAINFNFISKLNIVLPPAGEQYKIMEILSLWDKAILTQSTLIEKLELRKKGLMQQLLTGKKRLKSFKDEWNIVKIEDFANEYIELNKQKEELTVLSCTKYRGLVSSLEYFGKQVYSEDRRHYKIVPIYSFAYATNHIEEGSIGYQTGYDKALISPMYTVFTTSERVNNNFLYLLLKTHRYIAEYRKRMEGSIDRRGGLRWNSFSKIKIALPSLTEQKAIAEILSFADQKIALAKQKLEFFKAQKKGLMQQLLTGKTRVKPE